MNWRVLGLLLLFLIVVQSVDAALTYEVKSYTRPGTGGNFSIPRFYGLNMSPSTSAVQLWNVTCYGSTNALLYNFSSSSFIHNVSMPAATAVPGQNFSFNGTPLNQGMWYGIYCGTYGTYTGMYAAEIDGGNYTNATYFIIRSGTATSALTYNLSLFGNAQSMYNLKNIQVSNGTEVTVPVITAVQNHTITISAVTINWTTDVSSNTSVQYGTTTALGTFSRVDDAVTSHNRTLTGLTIGTTYYYNVTSCNSAGCNTSGTRSFTTLPQTLLISRVLPASALDVLQNSTFNYTAQVTCLLGACGFVNVTLVNVSATTSNTTGATPFYVIGQNPLTANLSENQTLNFSFLVNATGAVGTVKNFSAIANMSATPTVSNRTDNVSITITEFPNTLPNMTAVGMDFTSSNEYLIFSASATDNDTASIRFYTVLNTSGSLTALGYSNYSAQGVLVEYASHPTGGLDGNYSICVTANDGIANSSNTLCTTPTSFATSDFDSLSAFEVFLFYAIILLLFLVGYAVTKWNVFLAFFAVATIIFGFIVLVTYGSFLFGFMLIAAGLFTLLAFIMMLLK